MKVFAAVAATLLLSCPFANAQGDSADVMLSPNGITVRGKQTDQDATVRLGPGGITINGNQPGTKSKVRLGPGGISIDTEDEDEELAPARPQTRLRTTTRTTTTSQASTHSAAPAGKMLGDMVVNTNHEEIRGHCNGNTIVINSNHCELNLTGKVGSLVINGNHNTATAQKIGILSTNGNWNNVKWSQTPAPMLSNGGRNNQLSAK